MIILMAVYTVETFFIFRIKNTYILDRKYKRQNVIVFLFHLAGYVALYVNKLSVEILVFYILQVIFFVIYFTLFRSIYKKTCGILLNHMYLLLSISFIMLARLSMGKARKQFIIVCAAAVITIVIPSVIEKIKFAKPIAIAFGLIGIALLAAVWAIGKSDYGAKMSLSFGGFSVQPSEFVKITYVLLIAILFRKNTSFGRVLFTSCIAGVHVLILIMSKDLGSGCIYALTYICMLYVATKKSGYVLISGIVGVGGVYGACKLFSHVRQRFTAWIDPWSVIDNEGYQITQSLFAIGSGGWLGLGLYQGMPNKIPVVEKDFIFSAIAEEMGGFVALCLILICLSCFLSMLLIAMQMDVLFYKLVGVGLSALYGVQVFLMIGGVTKFIPSTGITLAFVSYGGSSILSTFIIFNIMQGLYIMKQRQKNVDYERERQLRLNSANGARGGVNESKRRR